MKICPKETSIDSIGLTSEIEVMYVGKTVNSASSKWLIYGFEYCRLKNIRGHCIERYFLVSEVDPSPNAAFYAKNR